MRVDFIQHQTPDGDIIDMEGRRYDVGDLVVELYIEKDHEFINSPPYVLSSVYNTHLDEFEYLEEGFLANSDDLLF